MLCAVPPDSKDRYQITLGDTTVYLWRFEFSAEKLHSEGMKTCDEFAGVYVGDTVEITKQHSALHGFIGIVANDQVDCDGSYLVAFDEEAFLFVPTEFFVRTRAPPQFRTCLDAGSAIHVTSQKHDLQGTCGILCTESPDSEGRYKVAIEGTTVHLWRFEFVASCLTSATSNL